MVDLCLRELFVKFLLLLLPLLPQCVYCVCDGFRKAGGTEMAKYMRRYVILALAQNDFRYICRCSTRGERVFVNEPNSECIGASD